MHFCPYLCNLLLNLCINRPGLKGERTRLISFLRSNCGKKNSCLLASGGTLFFMSIPTKLLLVPLRGIEPLLQDPESCVLSVERQGLVGMNKNHPLTPS